MKRSHAKIIEDYGGSAKVAHAIGAEPNTAKPWKRNDSIPSAYWNSIAKAGIATLEELAEAAAEKRPPPKEAA